MASIPRDWFDYTGFGIGAAGLAYAWWTSRRAIEAKIADRNAREEEHQRRAKDDMERLSRLANELLAALDGDHLFLALYVGREFISLCPGMLEQHREWLGPESGKLEVALGLVRKLLPKVQATLIRDEPVEDARRVVVLVSGLAGILRRVKGAEGR